MAKKTGTLLLVAGGVALLMMGKKKKKKGDTSGVGTGTGAVDPDTDLGSPSKPGETEPPTTATPSVPKIPKVPAEPAGNRPPPLKPDALWVSPDCKMVVFGDDIGELWWKNKGLPSAQSFVEANYSDPYEIAREMLLPIAPCVAEFPLNFDVQTNAELQFGREFFLRTFPDVYYLLMSLYQQIAPLVALNSFNLKFDEKCEVEHVGHEWIDLVARGQITFYLDFAYPNSSDYGFIHGGAWVGGPLDNKLLESVPDSALAVINRWSPDCAKAILEAYKTDFADYGSEWQEGGPSGRFFQSRPKLGKLFRELVLLGEQVDSTRDGELPFGIPEELKGS